MTYSFRKSNEEEIKSIWKLIIDRIDWMNEIGLQGWNTTGYLERYPIEYYKALQNTGNLFVLYDEDRKEIISAAALYEEDERWVNAVDSFYIHNLVADRNIKGAGALFITMAEKYAIEVGKIYMRLDSSKGNATLAAFYENLGYLPVGKCKDGVYEGILREKKLR